MVTSASGDGKFIMVAVVMGICYVAGLTTNKDIIGD
jgi:outer membrane murein-binding lipoprotein Lpp